MKKKPYLHDINPKAVTNDELFGFINPATREWRDGKKNGSLLFLHFLFDFFTLIMKLRFNFCSSMCSLVFYHISIAKHIAPQAVKSLERWPHIAIM